MEPKGTFGPRLRQERERRQISLTSIAANTKISQSLLEALERDDVSRWPSGIFRRAFIRSYANAVGLNADEIVKEFSERFPDPSDVPPAEPEPANVAAHISAVREGRDARPRTEHETHPRASAREHTPPDPDRIELVFRVSVPRSWVTWALRLSRAAAMPWRQSS